MAASIKIAWNGEKLIDSTLRAAGEGVFEGAMILREKIQTNISVVGPPHSLPGEAPHLITGKLQDSVKIKGNRNIPEARVVVEAPYALALEFGYAARNLAPRPFIRRSMEEVRSEVTAAIVNAIKRGRGNVRFADGE